MRCYVICPKTPQFFGLNEPSIGMVASSGVGSMMFEGYTYRSAWKWSERAGQRQEVVGTCGLLNSKFSTGTKERVFPFNFRVSLGTVLAACCVEEVDYCHG